MSAKVREADRGDREAILAISQRIWEGEDYIPFVVDGWLAEGGLIVAEVSGEVVGFAKTTELAPGEVWLEGLRVHPDHQGKGIAKALARAQLELALARRAHTVRLATVEANEASLHIAKELGFRPAARFFYAEAEAQKPQESQRLQRPALSAAQEFLRTSQALQDGQNMIGLGWRFRDLSPQLLAELAEKDALFSLGTPPQGLLILLPDPYTPAAVAALAFVDGKEEILPELLRFSHAWAEKNGQRILAAMVAAPWVFTFLTRHGFQFVPELGAVLVLEYHPK